MISTIATITGLYRAILRVHSQRLPEPMQALGNRMVRDEFRAISKADPPATHEQWQEFARQWERYLHMLQGQEGQVPPVGVRGRTGDLDEGVLQQLSPEQQQRLARLQREALELGKLLPPDDT